VRVETAFNRLLRLPGASVTDVSFSGEGVIVTVRLRRRRRVCSGCGQTGRLHVHGRRVKRWRHLDLGASRCVIECELRRLRCRDCGVRLEAVPWARAGARYTRDFEDVVVRHEASLNRVGCRSPPPGCRSSSVKRGAA
jgi:transposase